MKKLSKKKPIWNLHSNLSSGLNGDFGDRLPHSEIKIQPGYEDETHQERNSLALTGTLRTIPREINVGYVIAIPKFTRMLKAGRESNIIARTVTWFSECYIICVSPPKSRPATPQRKAQGMSSGEPMCSTCVTYKITGTKLMNTKLALPTMLRKSAASPNLALPRTILKSTWGVNKEEAHLRQYEIASYPRWAQLKSSTAADTCRSR